MRMTRRIYRNYSQSATVVPGADMTPAAMFQLMQQNMVLQAEQNQRYAQLLEKSLASERHLSNKAEDLKCKRSDEASYSPEEPVTVLLEGYKVEDDAHSKLELSLRQRLCPVNSAFGLVGEGRDAPPGETDTGGLWST